MRVRERERERAREKVRDCHRRLTNEQLAHELMLDPTFKLEEKGFGIVGDPALEEITGLFGTAFWESLASDITISPPDFKRVDNVLSEIRNGIVKHARADEKDADEIRKVIDIGSIRSAGDVKKLEWIQCKTLITKTLAVLQRMQSPQRGAKTQGVVDGVEEMLQHTRDDDPAGQATAFCRALKCVMECLNTIRVDAVNARLRRIAPVIKTYGVVYERTLTKKRLREQLTAKYRAEGRPVPAGLPTSAPMRPQPESPDETHLAEEMAQLQPPPAQPPAPADFDFTGLMPLTETWVKDEVRRNVENGTVTLQALLDGEEAAFERVIEEGLLQRVFDGKVRRPPPAPNLLTVLRQCSDSAPTVLTRPS
eukprot:3260936-Rhodomonas_salina.1